MPEIKFDQNFIFGASTAAYQIEGAWDEDGKGVSIWDHFAHLPGTMRHGHTGDVACDHYHRYREDVALMKELGLDSYRFSISWPRIFPQGKGPANRKGVDFYARLVDTLLDAGISPFITLFHWDMPQALWDDCRGWLGRDSVGYFTEFAHTMFRALGDRVEHWITHNEPKNVHIHAGYVHGNCPPQHKGGFRDGLLANHHMMLAHGKAVRAFRDEGCAGEIGITLAMGHARPLTDAEEDVAATHRAIEYDVFWNPDLLLTGRYSTLADAPHVRPFLPRSEPGDFETIATPMDFLGINHYRGNWIRHDDAPPFRFAFAGDDEIPIQERSGIGWPVTPESMYDTLTLVSRRYPRLKLYVTENGYADATKPGEQRKLDDCERIRFMQRYIANVHRAKAEGVNVAGYFAWSLMDNLEWGAGFEPRFGLISVDFDTLKREPKASAKWYRRFLSSRAYEM